jgi:hypothetical protein
MTLFVSTWDTPGFDFYCGFEVKKLVEILGLCFKTIPAISTRKKEKKNSNPEKRKHKYLPVSFDIYDKLSQHVLMCKVAQKCT